MKKRFTLKSCSFGMLSALVLTGAAWQIQAAEITLKAATAFGRDTFFNQRFKAFVDKVNAEGKGVMQIRVVGGPESIPPLELGSAVRSGVVDLANTTGVFHANLVPEAITMSLAQKTMAELRTNGAYAVLDQIHRDKANMVWLARLSDGLQYHIYLNKKVADANFSGMKLRSVPQYRPFFQALGATPIQMPPGEVYTALERGVVDGYGWPSVGIFDLGWQEKTQYRVEPGFYNVEVSLFMNQNTWKKLDTVQREFLAKQIAWVEAQTPQDMKFAETEKQRLIEKGIKIIDLTPEQAANFRTKAYEAGWKNIEAVSGENARKLKPLMSNP